MTFKVINTNEMMAGSEFFELDDVQVENKNWAIVRGSQVILPWIWHDIDIIAGRRWTSCGKFKRDEAVNLIGWDSLPRISLDTAFLVGGNDNYYHFTIDYLSRLYFYDKYLADSAVPILFNAELPWQLEKLNAYGVKPSLVVSEPIQKIFSVRKLFVSTKCLDDARKMAGDDYFSWLNERTKQDNLRSEPGLKLYVSRNLARSRRLSNEDELMQHLEPLGFIKMVPEETPISEQIALFKAAKVVVGPTGAGFTNIIYSSPDTALIEFMPGETWRPVQIKYLCEARNINYQQIVCPGGFGSQYFPVNIVALMEKLPALI